MTDHSTGSFKTRDNLEIFYQMWLSKNPDPAKTIVFHHGLGEHSGRYGHLLEAFFGMGYSFIGMDARGHGRSEGKRGDCLSATQLVVDLEEFIVHLKKTYKIKKPLLLGHSMGGIIVISFALRFSNQWELSGLVTSGAAIRPHLDTQQKIKLHSGRIIHKISPAMVLPTGLSPDGISHDKSEVKKYKNDPLVHDKISIRLAVSLVDIGEEALKRARLLKIPCLITHGGSDPIADSASSSEFFHGVSSRDKTLKIYPNLYHEIYNESPSDRKRVFDDLTNWVSERI